MIVDRVSLLHKTPVPRLETFKKLFKKNFNKSGDCIDIKDVKIGKKLGEGTYGIVNEGFYKGSKVIVKTYTNTEINKDSFEFLSEAMKGMVITEICEKYNISGFMKMYGYTCEKRPCCVISQYIEGVTLYELSKSICNEEFIGILLQVYMNLETLSKFIKFLHGDLHAGNIMVKIDSVYTLYKYKGYAFVSRYKPIIIDYGRTSLVFNNYLFYYYNPVGSNIIIESVYFYYDILLFLYRFRKIKGISTNLLNTCENILEKFMKKGYKDKSELKFRNFILSTIIDNKPYEYTYEDVIIYICKTFESSKMKCDPRIEKYIYEYCVNIGINNGICFNRIELLNKIKKNYKNFNSDDKILKIVHNIIKENL